MKKALKIILGIVIVLVVFIGIFLFKTNTDVNNANNMMTEVGDIDMTKVADGVYEGKYTAGTVSATVEVTVKDHVIVKVDLKRHANGKGEAAEVLTDVITEKNTYQVDTVSGATVSSVVIKAAVCEALKKGIR